MPARTSIRTRLMLIVGLALAPLAVASVIQAVMNFRAYQRETDHILVQTAMYAAYSQQNVFARAEQILRSIARKPELTAAPQDCYAALSDALVGAMPIVNFTRVDAVGKVICMGVVAPPAPAYARLLWWPAVRNSDRIVIGNQFVGAVVKRAILPVALPLRDHHGTFVGALSAAIDLQWLESAPQISKLPQGTLSLILDTGGHVLASNRAVPADLPQAVVSRAAQGKRDHVFTVNTDAGQRWRWVVEPIGLSDKLVAFGIPEPRLFGTFRGYLFADVLLTLLIVVATCVAIWLGTEWLVIRWTIYLKRVAVAYARNHFSLSLEDMNAAPDEFRLLGREMKRMALAIQERDRNLSQALSRQSAMTREIHHRVKNNLQIVSSLIAIYAQNIANPVAKSAFRQIIARVDALTLIQRLIEKSESEPTLDMRLLFEQLADQVRTLAVDAGQNLRLQLAIEDRKLSPDTATPMVLFAIEALTFDIFLPRPETRRREASLTLTSNESGYLLTVEDTSPGALSIGMSLSDRILRSLAEQLRGRYTSETLPQGGGRLILYAPRDVSRQMDRPNSPAQTNVYALDLSRSRQA